MSVVSPLVNSHSIFTVLLAWLFLRDLERVTWRIALAWISWGISLALAIGTIVDTRRASVGKLIDSDSPVAGKSEKLLKKRLRRTR